MGSRQNGRSFQGAGTQMDTHGISQMDRDQITSWGVVSEKDYPLSGSVFHLIAGNHKKISSS